MFGSNEIWLQRFFAVTTIKAGVMIKFKRIALMLISFMLTAALCACAAAPDAAATEAAGPAAPTPAPTPIPTPVKTTQPEEPDTSTQKAAPTPEKTDEPHGSGTVRIRPGDTLNSDIIPRLGEVFGRSADSIEDILEECRDSKLINDDLKRLSADGGDHTARDVRDRRK